MNLKNQYNFKEKTLGLDFNKENLQKVKVLINAGASFTTMAMSGVGVSYFLRYLVTTDLAYFIHVDLYSLSSLSKEEFFKCLVNQLGGVSNVSSEPELLEECRNRLQKLIETYPKVVIIFNRFDQLRKEFDQRFLSNIRSLRNIDPDKIVMIFTANKPLYEIAPKAIGGANLNFYSKYLYFKPYSDRDLKKLIHINYSQKIKKELLEKLIRLSGGHGQLLQVLINSQKQENLLLDHFVKLQMKELYDFLNYHQRVVVRKIALSKTVGYMDDYLLGIGMIKKTSTGFELFSPLFAEYIRSSLPLKLPVKEVRLFKFLRKHHGMVIDKDEIFKAVWGDDLENATDWALGALIYRLRKNPAFISQGYIIENHKKMGYSLVNL